MQQLVVHNFESLGLSLNITWSTISKANDFAILPLVSPESLVDKVTR